MLTIGKDYCILINVRLRNQNKSGCGSVWLERLVWDQDVAGSNPVTPIVCGCSSMVEHQPSKLVTWVRFPSPAFFNSKNISCKIAESLVFSRVFGFFVFILTTMVFASKTLFLAFFVTNFVMNFVTKKGEKNSSLP